VLEPPDADPTPSPGDTPTGTLWRHGDFMRLWTGQTISLIGSQVTLLALPLTAILVFKASAFQVGALTTMEFLPFVLFGLPVGVWVDRLRRKPILILADVGRLVVLGSIPLAYALGVLHFAQLYAVGFLAGVGTVFFDVAYGSYLPSLVKRNRLVEGNAKLEVSRSGAQLAGPGIAGLLVQSLSAPGAILADALSYLASVLSLLSIRTKEPEVEPSEGDPPRMRRQIGEGLRYVVEHPLLRPLLACTGTLNLFSMMGQAVLLLFAVRRLGLSPGEIGVILTVGSVGFLVGAFVAERIPRRLGVGPTLILAGFLIALGAVFIPLATTANAAPMLVLYGLIASFGGVIYNVNARSLIQTITPDRKLGPNHCHHAVHRLGNHPDRIVPGRTPGKPPWAASHAVDSGGRAAAGVPAALTVSGASSVPAAPAGGLVTAGLGVTLGTSKRSERWKEATDDRVCACRCHRVVLRPRILDSPLIGYLSPRRDASLYGFALWRYPMSLDQKRRARQRRSDSFRCRRCGLDVSFDAPGTAHRNHCPNCLWSRHVDDTPGDRAAECGSSMEPAAITVRNDGEWALIHRCLGCGELHLNRIAGDDNPLILLRLAVKPLAQPPFPLERIAQL